MNKRIKALAKLGLFYAPGFIKKPLQSKAQQAELQRAMAIAQRTRIDKEQLTQALSQFTFDSDVMLHCSTVNIGKVQGGAKHVCNTLLDLIVAPGHTLIASALPYRGAFAAWLDERRTFDVRTAPIAVNERLRQPEDALRSIHPTHSVVAIGRDAAFYTAEHHLDDTPFGIHSPYFKIIKRHAKTLLLGTTQNNVTFIHVIEDLLGDADPINVYRKHRYHIPCIDAQGGSLTVSTPVHAPWPSALRDCACMDQLLTERGLIQRVPLGEAFVSMFDCHDYAIAYLDYLANGHSIYGRHKVTRRLLNRIQEVKALLDSDK